MIQGTFESFLPRQQTAPCWDSKKNELTNDLQKTLERSKNGDFSELDKKIDEYAKQNHFFTLTEGKFNEVTPGQYKPVDVKIQVKEGTITWYFANVGHDETTQEFRNQIFKSAALGHLLVPGSCAKYYRGTNAMHVRRMHTTEKESMMNHNHYRVHDNHVTPDQFKHHLYGFLEAQKAYGIENKFLTKDEADKLISDYKHFDEHLDTMSEDGVTTLREKFHEQEILKWTDIDRAELRENVAIEEPCEVQELIVPLNERQINVVTTDKDKIRILPKEWAKHIDELDQRALDIIAKAGSEGQRSNVAHTRQVEGSILPTLPNAYTKLGELFEQKVNLNYPKLQKTTKTEDAA